MIRARISNYQDLQRQLEIAEARRVLCENELRKTFREFREAMDPVHIAKEMYEELAVDEEIKTEARAIGLNILGNLLIGGLLKKSGVAGFIGSTLLEAIPSEVLVNGASRIKAVFSTLFAKKSITY